MKNRFKILAATLLAAVFFTVCAASARSGTADGTEADTHIAASGQTAGKAAATEETAVAEEAATTEEAAAAEEVSTTEEAATADKAAAADDTEKAGGHLVCIDPGHSGAQTGKYVPIGPGSSEMKLGDSVGTHGSASGLSEYELTMEIAQKLSAELKKRGYEVILTHEETSTPIDCDARAEVANNSGADCLIRLHADGSDSASANGAMAINITSSNPWNAQTYSESRRLSEDVLDQYVAATGLSSRGILEEDNMTGNNWSQVPCTLIEMGFMTNPDEDLKMADPSFQEKMVEGLANGVDIFFERQ